MPTVAGADPYNRHPTLPTCNATGPTISVSAQYERPAVCNRVQKHELPHREYDPHTFHVRAEWQEGGQGQAKRRRKK